MSGSLIQPQVNLEKLAAAVRTELEQARKAWSNALGHAMNAGDALIAVQPKVAECGNNWKRWLKESCFVAVSTAELYMQLARHRSQIEAELQHNVELSLRAARRLISKSRNDEGDNGEEDEGEAENPSESVKPESLIEHWRRCPEQLPDLLDEIGVPGVLGAMSTEFGRQLRARMPAPKRKPFKKTLNLTANSTRNGRGIHSRH
jgi:hypothetical protein